MRRSVKLILYVLLAISACLFGWRFRSNYNALMAAESNVRQLDLDEVDPPNYLQENPEAAPGHSLGFLGGGLVLSLLGLGFLAARDLSEFIGAKASKTLFDADSGETIITPDYEKAEEEWGQGNFLEAIRILRDHLQKNPRAQHVALRIAEIYEKDLNNPLAAALEYEEVLKQKLPPERWGWAAIHLVNLYNGRLNQPDKAIALLRRIDAEYGETAAAEKARTRLAQLESEGIIPPAPAPEPPPEEPPAFKLPPGFAPKKK